MSLHTAPGASTEASSILCPLSTPEVIAEQLDWERTGKEKPKENFTRSGQKGKYRLFRLEMSKMAGQSNEWKKKDIPTYRRTSGYMENLFTNKLAPPSAESHLLCLSCIENPHKTTCVWQRA